MLKGFLLLTDKFNKMKKQFINKIYFNQLIIITMNDLKLINFKLKFTFNLINKFRKV